MDIDSLKEVARQARRLADASEQDVRKAERAAEQKLAEEKRVQEAIDLALAEANLDASCSGKLTLIIDGDYIRFRIFNEEGDSERINLIAEEETVTSEWDSYREEEISIRHRMHITLDQEDAELLLSLFKKESE